MTTPKRPPLADTLAHIDAAIADHAAKLDAQPPCLRCARKSLIDSPYCAYHLPPWTPYLQPALDEAARQSAAQLAATVKRTNAKATAPPVPEPAWDWFGRLLNRLIP